MSNAAPIWIVYLQGLLTPVIAVLGIGIAWFQYRLARDRLRLDLFEQRLQIYESVKKMISSYSQRSSFDDSLFREMSASIDKSTFLFGPEIKPYLVCIRNCLLEAQAARTEQEDRRSESERLAAVAREHQRLKRLFELNDGLASQLAPYLRIEQPDAVLTRVRDWLGL